MAFLDEILEKKDAEIALSRKKHKIGELKRMFKDAPPVRSFPDALLQGFGLIAEVKRKSPSAKDMLPRNVEDAPSEYNKSPIVKAVSVLTDSYFFGMTIDDLLRIKSQVRQPVLRKDFIVKEHQVYEARAYGADAVLLMANVLKKDDMRRLYDIVRELGMEALFEAHTKEEIEAIPAGAAIYGINSRKFMAKKRWIVQQWIAHRLPWWSSKAPDLSVDLNTFDLVEYLPKGSIKVAESGVKAGKVAQYRKSGFDAVLVGTSLLKAEQGIRAALLEFEKALEQPEASGIPAPAHAS
jgi:indole-3-glycerol phosphate synthase